MSWLRRLLRQDPDAAYDAARDAEYEAQFEDDGPTILESQRVLWHLSDELARVEAARPMYEAGASGYGWHGLVLSVLQGQTPDEARRRITEHYERLYLAAVAKESLHVGCS